MLPRALFILPLLAMLASAAYAALPEGSMKIYAVTSEGAGLVAELRLELEPGNGKIWSAVQPLVGTTTQSAERTAVEIAQNYSTQAGNYDYKFTIISDASVVEGPSAGAAMALLTVAMLKDRKVPGNVSITGTIDSSGFVGRVGGVFEKSREASATGIELFMIPRGEAQQTTKIEGQLQSINLVEYAPKAFGIKVVEVNTLDDVLRYAFSDIESIDVNVEAATSVPQFIPRAITYSNETEPMKRLTEKYITETTALTSEAKNAVSTTLIEDGELISVLLETINNAEQMLDDAELLNDHNYLYSAANYAFLARVNASLVADLSRNPSLVEPNSTVLEIKAKALLDNIKSLRKKLDERVPVDYIEYYISAQQRLSYAEGKVNSLLSSQVVVVDASAADEFSVAITQIQDYEFALAWYSVASDLYDLTIASVKNALPSNVFRNAPETYIVDAENGLAVLGEEVDKEDIARRLDAAKSAKEKGWYLSSIFDSVSALSLINAEIAVKDKDLNQLYSMIIEKISDVEQKMASSSHTFVWARLYLDHAKYYKESADFYYAQDQGSSTVSSLKSGISLAFLAENLFLVSEDIYKYYDALGPEGFIHDEPQSGPQVIVKEALVTPAQYLFAFLVVFSLGAMVVIVIAGRAVLTGNGYARHYSIEKEISHIKQLQQKIGQSFAKGKIKKEKYDALSKRYKDELFELGVLQSASSRQVSELDSMKAELSAFDRRLKDLERHYREGAILKCDYEELALSYKEGAKRLKAQIDERQLAMHVSKEKLLKLHDEISNGGSKNAYD